MEKIRSINDSSNVKMSSSFRSVFVNSTRAGLFFLLSSTGCSSTPAPSQLQSSSTFWSRERTLFTPESPWGEHEELVRQTRENLTLYVHAILDFCPEPRQKQALREVLGIRTEIKHFERFYLGKHDADLSSFLKWLSATKQWALTQRDLLR